MDNQRTALVYRVLLAVDVAVLGLAFAVSFYTAPYINYLLSGDVHGLEPLNTYLWLLVVIVPAWVLMLHLNGRYMLLILRSPLGAIAWSVVRTGFMSTALVAFYLYATKNPLSRVFIVSNGFISTIFLLIEKAAARRLIQFRQKKGWDCRSILILGADEYALWAIRRIKDDPAQRLKVWGCLEASQNGAGKHELEGTPVRGQLLDYQTLIWKSPIDEVLISPTVAGGQDVSDIVQYCETIGLTTRIIPDYKLSDPRLWNRIKVEEFLGRPALTIEANSPRVALLLAKRLIDVVLSALLLVVLAPVFLALAIAVKLTSPGPIFYRWRVVGRGIRPFTGYKFRTMVAEADALKSDLHQFNEMQGPVFKMRNDPRVTPLGRLLRKYSLDELPQLWSVFKGEMSLVGPRPPGPHEFERFEIWHRRKLSVKPGITCLWQVSGRNQIADFDDWVMLDLEYIDSWSLWLDFKILFKTATVVFKGTGV
ncbi:MAG: sugar transferase [Candidatus Binataceae bacterium]